MTERKTEQQDVPSDSCHDTCKKEYLCKEEILEHLRYSSNWNAPVPEWAFRVIEHMHGIYL